MLFSSPSSYQVLPSSQTTELYFIFLFLKCQQINKQMTKNKKLIHTSIKTQTKIYIQKTNKSNQWNKQTKKESQRYLRQIDHKITLPTEFV